jgi:hypothetical protein
MHDFHMPFLVIEVELIIYPLFIILWRGNLPQCKSRPTSSFLVGCQSKGSPHQPDVAGSIILYYIILLLYFYYCYYYMILA